MNQAPKSFNLLWWLLPSLLILVQTAIAQTGPLLLVEGNQVYDNIADYVQLCESEPQDLDLERLFDLIDTSCFQQYKPPGSLLEDQYVSKFSIRLLDSEPRDLIIQFGRSDLQAQSAVLCDGQLIAIKKAGLFFKRSERDVKEGNMTQIALQLQPNKTYQIYSHIEKHFSNLSETLNLEMRLAPKSSWNIDLLEKRTFQGIYFGLMLMMLVFALFFYSRTRRKDYLFYTLFIVTTVFNFLALEDFLGAYIFPENPLLRMYLAISPLVGLGVFYPLFIRHYIDTAQHHLFWDRVLYYLSLFCVALFVLTLLVGFTPFDSFFTIIGMVVGIALLIPTASGIHLYLTKPSKLRLFLLIGVSTLLLGYIANMINLKYRLVSFDGVYLVYVATLIEAFIFAAGLAFKTGIVEREKAALQAQQKTIQKEKERLAELGILKSRLYSNITHEFRTPLTLILGLSRQIKNSRSEKIAGNGEIIQRNGQLLLRLVNQILDLSKLESGKMELHFVNGDIVSFFKYLAESFHSLAESHAVQLHFLSELEALQMDYDPEKLQQVFYNLISNALKFTPEGGNIYLQISQQKATFVELKIRDTGIGMNEAELGKIFDRFYQIDDSATRKAAGTGIGLALVEELVKLMGGEINVRSKIDQGTRFILSLPIRNAAVKAEEVNIQVEEGLSNQQVIGTSAIEALIDAPKVLVIEDNQDVLQYITNCLASHFQVQTAQDGEEGIQAALKQVPDLIISDVMMPIKDGFEVCEALKKDRRTSHIPIILLTAKADLQSRLEGLEHGADIYLAKPFHEEELLLHLSNLLQHRDRLKNHYLFVSGLATEEEDTATQPLESAFVKQIQAVIQENIADSNFTVNQLSQEIALSSSQLHRKLTALTGYSAIQLIRLIRLNQAKTQLQDPSTTIAEVAFACGFSNPDYFSKVFKKEFGKTPSEFRKSDGHHV